MLREAIKYCRENGLEAIAAVAIIDIVESKKGLRICYAGFTASASTLHLLKLTDQLADCVNNDYIITDVKEIGRYPG
jgi:hypothetical protein